MSTEATLIFPELMYFSDYNGNFAEYFKAIYAVFVDEFIKSQPNYNNLKVSAPKHPLQDGIHRTFYHITHEGEDEQDRKPDIRRMERIRFPRFIIDTCPHNQLLVWEKKIGHDIRIHILNETEQYLVVLTRRDSYLLLWTAFFIERKHTIMKKRKEYEAYIKTKTA